MVNGIVQPPTPNNEPVMGFLPGSHERIELQAELAKQMAEVIEIPCIINGEEVWTGNIVEQVMPHNHGHVLAKVHLAGEQEVHDAINASLEAHKAWSTMPWEARGAIFLKAATMLAGERRQEINASTMLNQSKTCHQAEIDSACELIDFWRFNVDYARAIYEDLQPPISPDGVWNQSEIRPLEGFVFSITPFNFTSIAGNLPSCAAIMGNTGVWKPSRNSYVSNYRIMKLMMDAGLPAGVINFIPGKASVVGDICMSHPDLAGIHFTGSTGVFRKLWRDIANNLENLRSYPRIVGETGGKDFIVAHPECNEEALIVALLRGSFEFQGQKCVLLQVVLTSLPQYGDGLGRSIVTKLERSPWEMSLISQTISEQSSTRNPSTILQATSTERKQTAVVPLSQVETTMTLLVTSLNQQQFFVKTRCMNQWLKKSLDQYYQFTYTKTVNMRIS